MIRRAGGKVVNGKIFLWSNWYLDQPYFDEPFFLIPSYIVPDEWLSEAFDNRRSAYLMAMPVTCYN